MTYFVTFDAVGALATRLIKGVHNIPKGAVEVDDETWRRITQETDGVWTLGADGTVSKLPFVIDPKQLKLRLIESERAWRNGEIARVAWLRDRHRDEVDLGHAPALTAEQFSELLAYMQMLRDWPENQDFPETVSRPLAPDWIASQTQ
ncbi:phage tail assembly chaperone [Pseudomonas orientalis]|uniref:Phage tail protein n=1 Tax=Pseudomonas orientalis TaxID=76758 RepID=A0A4Q7D2K2_9PSED|nr:phage tail assembly chaperone [Pseudomonas orientalis]RZI33134.1 phage tail protein [Pseudomonas orientalis]